MERIAYKSKYIETTQEPDGLREDNTAVLLATPEVRKVDQSNADASKDNGKSNVSLVATGRACKNDSDREGSPACSSSSLSNSSIEERSRET
jgi:hypothetical protein